MMMMNFGGQFGYTCGGVRGVWSTGWSTIEPAVFPHIRINRRVSDLIHQQVPGICDT
jgi:hypothetical protein